MNAHELALELAQLDVAERDALLSELPEDRKSELLALIEEVQPLLQRSRQHTPGWLKRALREPRMQPLSASSGGDRIAIGLEGARLPPHAPVSFEVEWAREEVRQIIPASLRLLSEGQLKGLLAGEPQAVQMLLVAAIRAPDANPLPPAVQRVVTAHLMRRRATSSVQPEQSLPRQHGWLSFWRRRA